MSPEAKAKYQKERDYKRLIARMGIDPKMIEAHYEVLQGKEKVAEELKQLAKKSDEIILATDLDREGEAIACTCGN